MIIGLLDGIYREGVLDIGLTNEDWREDGEKEALGLLVGERLEEICLDVIQFIIKASDAVYVQKAV